MRDDRTNNSWREIRQAQRLHDTRTVNAYLICEACNIAVISFLQHSCPCIGTSECLQDYPGLIPIHIAYLALSRYFNPAAAEDGLELYGNHYEYVPIS